MDDILSMLEESGGNKRALARQLGIPESTLRGRIDQAHRSKRLQSMADGLKNPPKQTTKSNRKHCIIPDVQARPGVPLDHLKYAGEYIAEKRPDVIICIGDFADMPSLSSYDKGKVAAENKRYKYDLDASHKAM